MTETTTDQYVPLTLEEATWTDAPTDEFGPSRPWCWSDPIQAITQDSRRFGLSEVFVWPHLLGVYRGVIANLYSQGFVIARRAGSDVPAQPTADATPLPPDRTLVALAAPAENFGCCTDCGAEFGQGEHCTCPDGAQGFAD